MTARVQAAIIGATGFAGLELVELLARHPGAHAPLVLGRESGRLTATAPQLRGRIAPATDTIQTLDIAALKGQGVDVLFLATPHEQSRHLVPEALAAGLRVVDLSGAWRLRDADNRAVYAFADEGAPNTLPTQEQAVYGLPELHRDRIREAMLVANPGCYATSVILALAPLTRAGLLDPHHGIIADAESGVSGAGKAPTATTHFMHAAENLSAYGLYAHRHTGELVEQLGVARDAITFTPHLLPIRRGILSTNYAVLSRSHTGQSVQEIYTAFYSTSPMVRVHPHPGVPTIQHIAHTSYCDLGFALAPGGHRVTVISCLDNLLKGAASQAVQNMNLMFGFAECEGLL